MEHRFCVVMSGQDKFFRIDTAVAAVAICPIYLTHTGPDAYLTFFVLFSLWFGTNRFEYKIRRYRIAASICVYVCKCALSARRISGIPKCIIKHLSNRFVDSTNGASTTEWDTVRSFAPSLRLRNVNLCIPM